MTRVPGSVRPILTLLIVIGGLELAGSAVEARAGSVISTLGLTIDGTFPGEQVGAAVQIGSTPILLESVEYSEIFSNGPTPGETFAIFSRNADGTVGTSLFDAFTLSFDSTTSLTTATATSPFILQANTSYWLMMVETPGTFGDWEYSVESTYTSAYGVTIPAEKASVSTFQDENGYQTVYADASEGLQIFQLNGTAIPEPSALAQVLAGLPVVVTGFLLRRRRKTG